MREGEIERTQLLPSQTCTYLNGGDYLCLVNFPLQRTGRHELSPCRPYSKFWSKYTDEGPVQIGHELLCVGA
jgi:hypothetical protein